MEETLNDFCQWFGVEDQAEVTEMLEHFGSDLDEDEKISALDFAMTSHQLRPWEEAVELGVADARTGLF